MRLTPLFAPLAYPKTIYAVGDTTFKMLKLPGKRDFWMGSPDEDEAAFSWEKPRHQRSVSTFSLAEFPVTQLLWAEVVARAQVQGLLEEQELPPSPAYFQGTNRPVGSVNWQQARKFCKVLSQLTVGTPDFFRLPSEAEWEYAARAGTRETLYAGSNQLAEVGWFDGDNEKETMPVGLLQPNAFGLYDLSGNVWEWCEDDWHSDYKNHPENSIAWKDGEPEEGGVELRVLRGGSWDGNAWYCRSACRSGNWPDLRNFDIGFRLAASV